MTASIKIESYVGNIMWKSREWTNFNKEHSVTDDLLKQYGAVIRSERMTEGYAPYLNVGGKFLDFEKDSDAVAFMLKWG